MLTEQQQRDYAADAMWDQIGASIRDGQSFTLDQIAEENSDIRAAVARNLDLEQLPDDYKLREMGQLIINSWCEELGVTRKQDDDEC